VGALTMASAGKVGGRPFCGVPEAPPGFGQIATGTCVGGTGARGRIVRAAFPVGRRSSGSIRPGARRPVRGATTAIDPVSPGSRGAQGQNPGNGTPLRSSLGLLLSGVSQTSESPPGASWGTMRRHPPHAAVTDPAVCPEWFPWRENRGAGSRGPRFGTAKMAGDG
jgi:hypothetical protein